MTAALALLLMATGGGLVAGQGPPPGATVETRLGWALAAVGVLALLVAAVRFERSDLRADRAAAQAADWFWAPLVEPDASGEAEPAAAPAADGSARDRTRDRVRSRRPRAPRPA